MTKLQLSTPQAEALQQTLESVLADLSYEIANTDKQSFREGLKAHRDRLTEVLALLLEDGREGLEVQ